MLLNIKHPPDEAPRQQALHTQQAGGAVMEEKRTARSLPVSSTSLSWAPGAKLFKSGELMSVSVHGSMRGESMLFTCGHCCPTCRSRPQKETVGHQNRHQGCYIGQTAPGPAAGKQHRQTRTPQARSGARALLRVIPLWQPGLEPMPCSGPVHCGPHTKACLPPALCSL